MCGIVTIFAYHPAAPEVDPNELRRIRDFMAGRGPDGFGEWFSEDGRVGLAHRRLSIIDLSPAGSQPMRSLDGNLIVTFNGEIYNYKELRQDLEKEGCVFESQSDTEVLLHLYAKKGEALVHHLRGMFAFALWDQRKRSLLLARDPYGIKPLYYADDRRTIKIASQVKALLAGGRVSRTQDPAGVVGFFLFGSVPEPYTFYQHIRAVPAGSTMWVTEEGISSTKRYFSVSRIFQEAMHASPPSNEEVLNEVRRALLDSVRHHFVSDVPVGIFLSSGIDSGSLVALAREAEVSDLWTTTLTFNEFEGLPQDEAPLAEEVAQFFHTKHLTRNLDESEFRGDLFKLFEAMDQPTIDGVNTYFMSKAAKEAGLKVALSGLGGDELFGGYPSFKEIPHCVRMLKVPSKIPLLRNGFADLYHAVFPLLPLNPKLGGILEYGGSYAGAYFLRRGLFMPWELSQILVDQGLIAEGLRQLDPIHYIEDSAELDSLAPFPSVASLESSLYLRNQLLRDADWAGMAHSLEIRTPFVDSTLLKRLAPILISQKKVPGKKLLIESPETRLPKQVRERRKTGFSVPVDHWLETDPQLDTWKRVPFLSHPHCPRSRRWAYVVYNRLSSSGRD